MRYLNIDEAKELSKSHSITIQQKIEEAADSTNFSIYFDDGDFLLIKHIPEMSALREDCIGLWLRLREYENTIWVFAVVEGSNGICSWLNLDEYTLTDSLFNIVSKACKDAATCNECGNFVGYADIHQVSFAGKCCTNCLSNAKEKYEYAGWNH